MTRHTNTRRCPTCKASVLVGLNDDLAAFQVVVDPTPLTPIGEALALLAGRPTLHLHTDHTHRRYLARRDRWHIKGQPAGSIDRLYPFDVVAEHVCNADPLPACTSNLPDKPKTSPTPKGETDDLFTEYPF